MKQVGLDMTVMNEVLSHPAENAQHLGGKL